MLYNATATIDKQYEDEISEILFTYNALSVSSEIHGQFCVISALFDDIEKPHTFLLNNGFITRDFKDNDWKYKWLENYSGGELTENIFIIPSDSIEKPPKDYKFIIKIDPRDAFGDGNHPTTKQCAIFLENLLIEKNHTDSKLLDAGTGTGILAIIASLYGIKNIDAIDIEEESINRTNINLEFNSINSVNTLQADIGKFIVKKKYDIICANLLTAIIIENIDTIMSLGTPDCIYIISGIGIQWKEEIETLFSLKKLEIKEFSVLNDWCCFKLVKSDSF